MISVSSVMDLHFVSFKCEKGIPGNRTLCLEIAAERSAVFKARARTAEVKKRIEKLFFSPERI